jgi:hypothetical protein
LMFSVAVTAAFSGFAIGPARAYAAMLSIP